MSSFFEVMSRQQLSAPDERMPEFLRTHPVTSARIAEARSRSAAYPRVSTSDSTNYGLVQARLRVAGFDTSEQAVSYFERRDYENQTDVERYGRAVAYQRAGRDYEARRIFEYLVEKDKKVIAFHIGLGQSQLALEQYSAGRGPLTRQSICSRAMCRWSSTTANSCCNSARPNRRTQCCST